MDEYTALALGLSLAGLLLFVAAKLYDRAQATASSSQAATTNTRSRAR